MNNEELYHKTVNILVQAYFNDTLEHTQCRACAVGNIVAANMGMKLQFNEEYRYIAPTDFVPDDPKKDSGLWFDAIGSGDVKKSFITEDILRQVKATGYSPYELMLIEFAFEHPENKGSSPDEYMFNGLMSVIDVLDEIHENKDSVVTQVSKSKFQKEPI